jgi:hypothetical protein
MWDGKSKMNQRMPRMSAGIVGDGLDLVFFDGRCLQEKSDF